SSSSSSTPP
ncbi:unnamed protein product, partial [Rotaria sp. Silwood1]